MKKILIFLMILAASSAFAQENFMYFDYQISLLVFDPEAVQERILDWAENRGGNFIYRADDCLQMRVPWKAASGLRELLTGMDIDILSFNQNAADMRDEILKLKSGIKSREEILAKNLALIDRADTKGTLAIEQEVVRLISEIETMKGRLNKLEYDRQMAYLNVSFNFKQSARPENVDSSFNWLNQLDMYEFLQGGVQ